MAVHMIVDNMPRTARHSHDHADGMIAEQVIDVTVVTHAGNGYRRAVHHAHAEEHQREHTEEDIQVDMSRCAAS